MNWSQRILVGLSGSEHDEAIIVYARNLAKMGIGRRYEFMHVVEPETPSSTLVELQARIEAYVKQGMADLSGKMEVMCQVVPGIRTDVLMMQAVQSRADIILLGHRRIRSGRRSLARRLAMISPSSIWLVPEGAPLTIDRMLAPVDFSDNSADALSVAADIACKAKCQSLTVMHVSFDNATFRYDEHRQEMKSDEMNQLREFLAGVETQEVTVKLRIEEGPNPGPSILRVAEEIQADLLILSTRGRSRAAAVLLGSVTAHIMERAPVAVLAVKHFGALMGLFEVLRDKNMWKATPSPKTN